MNLHFLTQHIQARPNVSLGMYIHIPFCRVRCQFCAFYVQTHREERVEAYLEGLNRELRLYAGEVGLDALPVSSVYFGGGTPTVLSSRQLTGLLDEVRKWFNVTTDAEISVEAHPGTVNFEYFNALQSEGFNRLSIGAQSFDDQELLQLGGRSVSQTTHIAVESARKAGFDNISLDLMYGFPGHTTASWKETLDATIALAPNHLSCYAFTVEEGSHVFDMVERKAVPVPNEAVQASLGDFARQYLDLAGYEQYEISNFCRSGFSCKHNLRYWQGESYLGLGPSGQSFVSGMRFGNVADLEAYCQILAEGEFPLEDWNVLNNQEIQREKIIFGLRTRQGVSCDSVRSLFGTDVVWARAFSKMKDQGLILEEEGYVRLTRKGIQFSDTVAVALI